MRGDIFSLSPGQAGDAPEGRKLLMGMGEASESCPVIMDRAYEEDETKNLVSELGFSPVAPPKNNRGEPWEYDKEFATYIHRLNRLNSVFPQPLSLIQNDFPSLFESEPVRLIDSMPIMLAKPQRGGSRPGNRRQRI